jgi:membrane associated rhomboid family serine protease
MFQLIPLGDDNEGRLAAPVVTYVLIAINLAVFFLLQLPNDNFTYGYSVVPAEITSGHDIVRDVPTPYGPIPQSPGPSPIFLTILTAMFMHGSYMHLFGNMLYLWIFGDNVEDAMGRFKFLVFYLICGLAATFAQEINSQIKCGAEAFIAAHPDEIFDSIKGFNGRNAFDFVK